MRLHRPATIIVVQAAAVMAALLVLAMWPPARGRMLIVPVAGADVNQVAKTAIAGGALLLGSGPFPGSLVVVGERAALSRAVPSLAMIVMAAPPAGCGTSEISGAAI